jgi:SAM-dependent methyltransferase
MVGMSDEPPDPEYRFYRELATWWPLISPPEEYLEEAGFVAGVLGTAGTDVHDVLELGSGGGHNAVHLKQHFTMTLVDLSEEMLDVSRRLNPDCEHQQGDMRTVRLGRTFDAVFVHDAVDYMTNREDLQHAVGTAFEHCRPGGVAVFVPDATAETFEESTDHGGRDGIDDEGLPLVRGVRYLEWTWDPDPTDSWVQTEYSFLLRDDDGSVRAVHESHRTGIFHRDVWIEVLTGSGFEASDRWEETTEDRPARQIFIGERPAT